MESFIGSSWKSLKTDLVPWLQSRIPTAERPGQRRAIEYALLVLFAQSEDYRSMWLLLENEKELSLTDVRPFLEEHQRWRALSFVLQRKGRAAEADRLWKEKGCRCDLANRTASDNRKDGYVPADQVELEATALFLKTLLPPQSTIDFPHRPMINDKHHLFWAIDCQCPAYVHDVLREFPECMMLVDHDGNTPLHIAVATTPVSTASQHYDLPRKLSIVARLCDTTLFSLCAQNNFGHTPIEVALHFIPNASERNAVVGVLLAATGTAQWCNRFAEIDSMNDDEAIHETCFGLEGKPSKPEFGSWNGIPSQ